MALLLLFVAAFSRGNHVVPGPKVSVPHDGDNSAVGHGHQPTRRAAAEVTAVQLQLSGLIRQHLCESVNPTRASEGRCLFFYGTRLWRVCVNPKRFTGSCLYTPKHIIYARYRVYTLNSRNVAQPCTYVRPTTKIRSRGGRFQTNKPFSAPPTVPGQVSYRHNGPQTRLVRLAFRLRFLVCCLTCACVVGGHLFVPSALVLANGTLRSTERQKCSCYLLPGFYIPVRLLLCYETPPPQT